MRARCFFLLLFLALPLSAFAQGPSAAQIERAKGLHWLFTTAALPASCNPGRVVWDSTAQILKACQNDGVTWSTVGSGVTADGNNTFTGSDSFQDGAKFQVVNQADTTKKIQFDAASITTGTARTYTMPDISGTVVTLNNAGQIFTASFTVSPSGGTTWNTDVPFQFGSANNSRLYYTTNDVPTTLEWGLPAASNAILFLTKASQGFNFAHALQTNPTVFVHSANSSTTQWLGLTHDATNGVISTGVGSLTLSLGTNTVTFGNASATPSAATVSGQSSRAGTDTNVAGAALTGQPGNGTGTGGSGNYDIRTAPAGASGTGADVFADRIFAVAKAKALTEAVATSFVQIGVTAGAGAGGEVHYCIHADDGTDFQERCGDVDFAAVNKAGTMTCSAPNILGTEATALSLGTLTNTFTFVAGTNACLLQANSTSSLTQTTLEARYTVTCHGTCIVTPQ